MSDTVHMIRPLLVILLPEASLGLRVLSLPASVRQSVRHQVCPRDNSSPIQARITKRCKTLWLRSLLFWGAIDLDLQGQI